MCAQKLVTFLVSMNYVFVLLNVVEEKIEEANKFYSASRQVGKEHREYITFSDDMQLPRSRSVHSKHACMLLCATRGICNILHAQRDRKMAEGGGDKENMKRQLHWVQKKINNKFKNVNKLIYLKTS